MKKQLMLYTVLFVIVVLFSSCRRDTQSSRFEDSSWAQIKVKASLVIGISDYVPILSFRNEKQLLVGYDIDILTEACARLGISPIFSVIDWTKKEELLNEGRIDCIASGFSLTEDRKKRYLMCMPYLQNAKIIVTRAKNKYQSLKDLRGKTIAVEAGTDGGDILSSVEQLKGFISVLEFDTIDALYKGLDSGACDAAVLDLIYSCNMLDENPRYTIIPEALATEYYTFAFRKADQSLANKIEAVLVEMENDGTVPDFSKKWFHSNLSILNIGL